jgi:WD40 repeat protein
MLQVVRVQGAQMRIPSAVGFGVIAFVVLAGQICMARQVKTVHLPFAYGTVMGAAFSPDSSRIAVIMNVPESRTRPRHILQIVELGSGQQLGHADVLGDEAADLAMNPHLIGYSSDGCYLLLATRGSDVLTIIETGTLHPLKRIALHPETDARASLGQGQRYFRGVEGLSVSAKENVFAVLTHDETRGNELFVGSFSLGRIVKSWNLGRGRIATELGQISLSLSEDGSTVVATLLSDEDKVPKQFKNVRLFRSTTGEPLKSVRTDGLVGEVALLPNSRALTAQISSPGLFSKKACLERWNLNTGTLEGQFCDEGRNVIAAFDVTLSANLVVGFGSKLSRSFEGQIYSASGRVDVWDLKSGALVASSNEMPHFVSSLQISSSGEWLLADQELLQLSPLP